MTSKIKQAVYIPADNTKPVETKEVKPTLEESQKYIEGYIQPVPCDYGGSRCQMLANEEGFQKKLPVNTRATKIIGQTFGPGAQDIVGNVIILVGWRF